MNLFDLPAARAFAGGFDPAASTAKDRPDDILSKLSRQVVLLDGTDGFSEARNSLLRHAEMGLLLSASNVRRSLDLMRIASSPWAQVTLYYAAWHAGSSILAMLGGYVGRRWWLGAERTVTGDLAIRASSAKLNRENSHRRFWVSFYDAIQQFEPWIAKPHKGAAMPVNGDALWMTTERNLVNYHHFEAEVQAAAFAASFDVASFPACLSGPLATQYHVSLNLLGLCLWLADEIKLKSDMLARLGPGLSRSHAIVALVADAPHPAVSDDRLDSLLRHHK
ncbi:MAG: hypothetical protein ACLGH3_04860 [Actinomycetota bacterium]